MSPHTTVSLLASSNVTDMGDGVSHSHGSSSSSSVSSSASTSASKISTKSKNGMRLLSSAFKPGPHDVICARGKVAKNHIGNCRYRDMVSDALDRYSNAVTKIEKTVIVSDVVDRVRSLASEHNRCCNDGGFVKCVDGQWHEVGDHLAREKVGQSFRDSLHMLYKSSTKAKKLRRDAMAVDGTKTKQGRTTPSSKKTKPVAAKKRTDAKVARKIKPAITVVPMRPRVRQQQMEEETSPPLMPIDSFAPILALGEDPFADDIDMAQPCPVPKTTLSSVPSDMFLSSFLSQNNVDLMESLKQDEGNRRYRHQHTQQQAQGHQQTQQQQAQQQSYHQNQQAHHMQQQQQQQQAQAQQHRLSLSLSFDSPFLFADLEVAPEPAGNDGITAV